VRLHLKSKLKVKGWGVAQVKQYLYEALSSIPSTTRKEEGRKEGRKKGWKEGRKKRKRKKNTISEKLKEYILKRYIHYLLQGHKFF
jgi:predicted transposase YdaD